MRVKMSRRARWAVPGTAVAVTAAVVAALQIPAAQASPNLPNRTPAQLLASISTDAKVPPMTGTVTEFTQADQASAKNAAPKVAQTPLTPQQAANQVLAKVGKTTLVSVQANVMVAGEPSYQLVLAPKDSRSLVGKVVIAIDGK